MVKKRTGSHINVLELRAIFFGLKALCGSESNTHIHLYCDNTLSCAYLRNFGGKKRYLNVLAIDIWNWCISCNIHLSISHVAGCLNVEADELSRGLNLNEDLEWALDMDIFRRLCVGLANPTLTFLPLGSIINLKDTLHLDQIFMQWQWILFQYLDLTICLYFCTFQHPQYGFKEDCGRGSRSISSSPVMDNSKLVTSAESSDCGFSHKTSSNAQNIVSAKQPRENSPTTKTEAGGISRIREFLQGRGIQGESSDLIIQAWRQPTKKQYKCYRRKWLKFSGSREINLLQPSINVVIEILYDLYKSGVQYSGIGTARSALSGFLSLCSEGQVDIGNSVIVKKIMRGVLNKRPALPKYRTT